MAEKGRPKGGKKYGGAVKGKSSKRAKLLEQIKESGKDGPVEVLLKEMWADDTEPNVRRKIAEVLLPYIERKQPTEIEQDNTNHYPTGIDITFTKPETPDEP